MRLALVFLLLIAACAAETLTLEQAEFKKICAENNDPFMLMSETKNGQVVGPACYGCMPDERNHICTLEEYRRFP